MDSNKQKREARSSRHDSASSPTHAHRCRSVPGDEVVLAGKQVPGVPWGEVIAAVSGLLGGGLIGWYGHRVARRNAQDTNRLKLTELQKQDIRWAQELI